MAVAVHAGRMEAESRSIAMAQDVPECPGMVQVIACSCSINEQIKGYIFRGVIPAKAGIQFIREWMPDLEPRA